MIGWNRLEFKDYFNECIGDTIIHPDDFEKFRSTLLSMSEECREAVFETRILNLSGVMTIHEVRTRFLDMENGCALVTVIFADITERKRLRRELMIKNERYNIIQKSSEQTIFSIIRQQNQGRKVSLCVQLQYAD